MRSLVVACIVALLVPVGAATAAAATDTVGLVDPASGRWHLLTGAGTTASFFYGDPGDVPFLGDWDCDGVDTPGLYRQTDGYVYLRNANTQGIADIRFYFGNPGDVPLAGDFDGDGCDTVSLYRPAEQRFYVIDRLGDGDRGLGAATHAFVFGDPGDRPFAGDVDGDGRDEIALHRPATGLVYYRTTLTAGVADVSFVFGDPGDALLAGDWTGSGTDTVGLFRPDGSGFYLRHANAAGMADERRLLGDRTWSPVAGNVGGLVGSPAIALRKVVTGRDRPVFLDAPPGDPRLFVVEQTGRIRVVVDLTVLAQPYLTVAVGSGGERGLLGLAFHPDFAVNGRFFVDYTDAAGDTVVAEYHADPAANVADPAPVRTVLRVPQPASNHNGGMLAFGPDGYLYVALGDGGGAGDPQGTGQDTADLLGSILRVDVDGAAPYAIPADNPLVGAAGRDEVWAWGLRNPWRFSFDPVTGDLLAGDVGQGEAEEIDLITRAANLGWAIREGAGCYRGGTCASAGLTGPIAEYGHGEGCSVTGGYVYRGNRVVALSGRYVYSDFCAGWIRSFRIEGGAAIDHRDHTAEIGTVPRVVSFGTDGGGELYLISLDGGIYRFDPVG